MKQLTSKFLWLGSLSLSILLPSAIQAQITPDNTVGTQVNLQGDTWEITGGTQAGSNLFHSFQDFSLPTNNTALFDNASSIANIISRITGSNSSNIDGLIKANGVANLILINPNGIQFGANAQLDLGGSFLGSTASSIQFADGTEYSAINPQTSPLLTVSVPIGLQWNQGNGAINVTGEGHKVSEVAVGFAPFIRGEVNGLKVKPNQTLALLGNGVTLTGGSLTAEGGSIELGSVAEGLVNLNSTDQGWTFGYEKVESFANLELRSLAIADASGVGTGSIHLQANNISLTDGSMALIVNEGEQPSGKLSAEAVESITFNGTSAAGDVSSGLYTEALNLGKGGDIIVNTQQLQLQQGGVIFADTFSPGDGGNVTVNASKFIEIHGFSPIDPNTFSVITSTTFGSGDAGDVTISTKRLTAVDGGNLTSTTGGLQGTGDGGDVLVNASELVELIGVTPGVFTPSQITAGTGGAGNAGTVTVNSQKVVLRDGGRIDASTLASGDAGSVTVNASDSIEVSGTVPNSLNPSLIISSANIVDPFLQQLLELPPLPSGNSGDVTINTSYLSVTDGALITTRNDGLGNSGSIRIDADSIFLNNDSGITSEIGIAPNIFSSNESSPPGQPSLSNNFSNSSSQSSENIQGGGIDISTQTLFLEGGAIISTNTFTDISGGNIIIDASSRIQVQGFSAVNPSRLSFISTSSFGAGDAGDLNLSTGKLTILDGGSVGAGTFGTGLGGNINVEATESISVIGAEPSQSVASLLGASSLGAGDAGNLTIETTKLVVEDGGRVDSAAAATGSAGNVEIKASESIEISGTVPGTSTPSLISSGANVEAEITQQIFRLPPIPSGDAGSVTIETGVLKITDGAEVSVVNEGSGDAGTLKINADSISLARQGTISAATQSGAGGNIILNAGNIIWRRGSSTIATATGSGNGGNITIDANNLVFLEGSQLTADANQGQGGNIQIETQGLFLCPDCSISADSDLGVDGIVDIITPAQEANLEIVDLDLYLSQPEEIVALVCQPNNQTASEFTLTGRGGLPPRPTDPLNNPAIVSFQQNYVPNAEKTPSPHLDSQLPPPASGWYLNSEGVVVLTAQPQMNNPFYSGLKPVDCQIKDNDP